MIKFFYLLFFLFIASYDDSRTFMDKDNTGDNCNRITTKGFAYEVSECVQSVRFITSERNKELKKYVFIFGLHVIPVNDRYKNINRQRSEIRTSNASLYFTHIDKIINEKTSLIHI